MIRSHDRGLTASSIEAFIWGNRSVFDHDGARWAAVSAGALAGAVALLGLQPHLGASGAVAVIAAFMALPVGVSKSATACGVNVLLHFSDYDRPVHLRWTGVLAYAVASVTSAVLVGLILGLIGSGARLWVLMPLLAPLTIYSGLHELGFFPRHRPLPSSRWQVPARWVSNPRTAPVIWGLFLGSGLTTMMPYPTYYCLLLLAVSLPLPLGPALLGLYGFARVIPAFATTATQRCSGEQFQRRAW